MGMNENSRAFAMGWGMAQAVEHLPGKCETLSSNPSLAKKNVGFRVSGGVWKRKQKPFSMGLEDDEVKNQECKGHAEKVH
jgi:hypothetical protein